MHVQLDVRMGNVEPGNRGGVAVTMPTCVATCGRVGDQQETLTDGLTIDCGQHSTKDAPCCGKEDLECVLEWMQLAGSCWSA